MQICKKASASGGLRLLVPLPGLCPWTPLGDFHHPKLLIGQCSFWASLGESSALPPKKFQKSPKKFDETKEPEARIHGWIKLTKILVPICLYCLNCTKSGQLILKKIIKIVATRCQILRLKCTKFDFGWGSAPDPTGGAYSAPPDP